MPFVFLFPSSSSTYLMNFAIKLYKKEFSGAFFHIFFLMRYFIFLFPGCRFWSSFTCPNNGSTYCFLQPAPLCLSKFSHLCFSSETGFVLIPSNVTGDVIKNACRKLVCGLCGVNKAGICRYFLISLFIYLYFLLYMHPCALSLLCFGIFQFN